MAKLVSLPRGTKLVAGLPSEVKKGQFISFDFETYEQEESKLHRPTGIFACISVAIEGDSNIYQIYDKHDLRKLYQIIKKGTFVCHNALYDIQQFRRFAPVKPCYVHDTMMVDQAMQGGLYKTFSLSDLSRRWLGEPMSKDVREDFSRMTEMTPQMKIYAARDAWVTLQIALRQQEKYAEDDSFKVYSTADAPMIFPTLDMPGFRVDVEGWKVMVGEFQKKSDELENELGINVMSGQQVMKKAKDFGLHLQNTQAATLKEFIKVPFIEKVIETRMYRKAVSTYGLPWLDAVEEDGKVYAAYHITGASMTGRMSCSDPNMQNLPQRKLPQYRARFIASDGHVIEVSDVAQQEPCITAWHTQDANLLRSIRNQEDLHLAVARKIYSDPSLTKADSEKRAIGKAINLGLTYGLTSYGLAARTGISEKEADRMIQQYFRNYGGVFAWIQNQRNVAYRKGYVSTALGRKSWLNMYDRAWENNAINSPIQGGAADFTKIWVHKIWDKSKRAGLPYGVVGLVHDEIVRDIPKECVKECGKVMQSAFNETAEMLYPGVPFRYDTEHGRSWGAKALSTEQVEIEE